MKMNLILLLLWIIQNIVLNLSSILPDTIKIVGLFDEDDKAVELAFRDSIEKTNIKYNILPESLYLQPKIQKVQDSFDASIKVCKIIQGGVAAIFGPSSYDPSRHVQSICNSMSIPYIQTHWDARDVNEPYAISLYPHFKTLGKAYAAIIDYWQWTKFTVVYDSNDGIIRVQEVLEFSKHSKIQIKLRKLDPDEDNWLMMFNMMKTQQEHRIIIDCHIDKVGMLLSQALTTQTLDERFHLMFTTLDLASIDLTRFTHGGANITSFRLVDPSNPTVRDIRDYWAGEEADYNRQTPLQGHRHIRTDVALMYDGVLLIARTLRDVGKQKAVMTDNDMTCVKPKTWADGQRVLKYMKNLEFEGLSGKVILENGQRNNFHLDIVELSAHGLHKKIGSWTLKQGINITKTVSESKNSSLGKRHFKVVTKLDEPYVMKIGAKLYKGFVVDFLNELGRRLTFTYDIYDVNGYGKCTTDKEGNVSCDYMLEELRKKRADLAVAGLTITHDRERYVDFTKPFLNLGITILYKKPKPAPPHLFSFLDPLSIKVWIYLLATFLCVSFMLFLIARLTPYEWVNRHLDTQDTASSENQFSILNSLWCSIGALMQQGSEIAPQAISTRMVACCWWFFTLIIISSYTANLAAFLTVERMVSPIESADDLKGQSEISYGTQGNGSSTYEFFKTSSDSTYKALWEGMANRTDVFVDNNENGTAKVVQGNYAFFTESLYVEYITEINCDLMQVNKPLDSKGYGIAFPSGSPYRDIFSSEILDMVEKQIIAQFKKRWWKEKNNGTVCSVEKKKANNPLTMDNVGGVFIVVAGGVIGGFLISICEFIYKARQNAKVAKLNLCSEMSEEFRFAVPCLRKSKQASSEKNNLYINETGMLSKPTMIPNCNDRFTE